MRLEDIKGEFEELYRDIRNKTRENIMNYQGNTSNYEKNRNRAIAGFGVALLAYPFLPLASFIALGYGGVKAYQAYKDKKNVRG